MSGGYFDHKQYLFKEFANEIQGILDRQGDNKDRETLFNTDAYYLEHPEDLKYPVYSKDIQTRFKEAIYLFKLAEIYATRIDRFLSGDDGEQTCLDRLYKDKDNVKVD